MKYFVLLIFILALATGQVRSGALSGKVMDGSSREGLPGVSVFFPELNRGTVSDGEGNYIIKNLPESTLKVQVSFIGYSTIFRNIEIKGNITEDFSLSPSSFNMEEVVVSSGGAKKIAETPFRIESIKAKEIFQNGSINMMEGISSLTGVNQISLGPGIGKPVIRGLSFSRILTIYQGARFDNQQWGEDHGIGLNDPGIDRVEVIKGPASLIYGSGAVGGVINIIDENQAPEGKIEGEILHGLFSGTLGSRTNIGVKGANEKGLFWSIRSGLESHGDYVDGNNRIIGNSRFSNQSLKLGTGFIREKSSTKLTYVFFSQKLGIIEEDEMIESLATTRFDRSMQLPFQHVTDHLLSLQHIKTLRKGTFKLNLASHQNIRKEIEDEFDEIDLGLVLSTYNFDAKLLLPAGIDAELITGIQGFYQRNRNMSDAHEILMPDADLADVSFYSMFSKKLGKFNFQSGLRYDYRKVYANTRRLDDFILPGDPESRSLDRDFAGFSGSAGLTYRVSDKINLKANAASGFRAPDLAELFSNGEHPGTNRFEKGNVSFGREQNMEFDLGALFHTRSFSFEIAGFHNIINNYIFFNPTGERMNDLTVWQFEQEDVVLRGGEAGLKYNPGFFKALELHSDYSLVYATKKEDGAPVPQIPANRWNNNVRLKVLSKQPLFLNFRIQHVSSQNRTGENELATPEYTLLGAGVSTERKYKKVLADINLSVNNIANRVYFEHLAVTRPFGVPNMGRNITLNVKLRI